MTKIKLPGFTADRSLSQLASHYPLVTTEFNLSGDDRIIPQYCHCYLVGTRQCRVDPTGHLYCSTGPPYRQFCYGSGCHSGKTAVDHFNS